NAGIISSSAEYLPRGKPTTEAVPRALFIRMKLATAVREKQHRRSIPVKNILGKFRPKLLIAGAHILRVYAKGRSWRPAPVWDGGFRLALGNASVLQTQSKPKAKTRKKH